jgi:3-oxoadipate enol-lactonase
MPQPGMSPEDAARVAFSVACGTAFLASKNGQAFIDQQIADMGKYPVTPMHTFTRQMEAIMPWDSYDRLAQIKAPTLIFHGDDDRLLPHANAEILHSKIPGSKVHILKGIGHMFFWEAPEESVKIPGDFVAPVK